MYTIGVNNAERTQSTHVHKTTVTRSSEAFMSARDAGVEDEAKGVRCMVVDRYRGKGREKREERRKEKVAWTIIHGWSMTGQELDNRLMAGW